MYGEKHHESRLGHELFLDLLGLNNPYGDDDSDDDDYEDEEYIF